MKKTPEKKKREKQDQPWRYCKKKTRGEGREEKKKKKGVDGGKEMSSNHRGLVIGLGGEKIWC